jgi:hypothetical protein
VNVVVPRLALVAADGGHVRERHDVAGERVRKRQRAPDPQPPCVELVLGEEEPAANGAMAGRDAAAAVETLR